MKKIILMAFVFGLTTFLPNNSHAFVLKDFAIFATERAKIGGGSIVKGGLTGSDQEVRLASGTEVDGVAGAGKLTGNNGVTIYGDVVYDGTMKLGSGGDIYGDVDVDGNAVLHSSEIHGDLTVSGSLTNFSTVTGTITAPGSPVPYVGPTLPAATAFSAGGASIANNASGQSVTLAPGTYGVFDLHGFNNTLKLSAGNYYFDSFRIGSGGDIQFDLTGGNVNLYIVGDMLWGNTVHSSLIGGDSTQIYTELHGKWHNSGGGNYYGVVYAPFDDIVLANNFDHVGALYSGKEINLQHGVTVNFVPVPEPLSAALLGIGFLGAARLRKKHKVVV